MDWLSSGRESTSSCSEEIPRCISDEWDNILYVAVPKDNKAGRSTLLWAVNYFPSTKKIFLVHVHRPSKTIPMMGGQFPISQLSKQEVRAYHQKEREKVDKALNSYISLCRMKQVQAEKLVIENDDVAQGLVELTMQLGIRRLVMGAAADRSYSKNMSEPRSSKACTVQNEAQPLCQIWFVCKGNLICVRECNQSIDDSASEISLASTSSKSTRSEPSGPRTFSGSWFNFKQKPRSRGQFPGTVPDAQPNYPDSVNGEHNFIWEGIPRSFHGSDTSLLSGTDESSSHFSSSVAPIDGESEDGFPVAQLAPDVAEDSQVLRQKGSVEDDILFDKLQEALSEVDKSKEEAHAESQLRRKAEMEALESTRKAKAMENRNLNEIKLRKEAEEALIREKMEVANFKSQQDKIIEELRMVKESRLDLQIQVENLELKYKKEIEKLKEEYEEAFLMEKMEVENLKKRQDEILQELEEAHEQIEALQDQVTESDLAVNDLKKKLSSQERILEALERERDEMLHEKDDAIRELEELRQARDTSRISQEIPNLSEFSYSELDEATRGFDSSLLIGEGGYGCVYKGSLRHTTVAIKILRSESLQGLAEFHQEIEVLTKVRHPNLVTLIGACSEAQGVVYEFLPNGSLEDRLACKDNTPPLSWQVRIRICVELCSALIFLHSNKPQSVVHGDLKPANILLDSNLTCKLSDLGISRLLVQSSVTTTLCCKTDPKGTFLYMDPEFSSTGVLTKQSDVYSLGIIILRLLIGKQPLGIVKMVKDALKLGTLQEILDPSSGAWPFAHALELAKLGVRCCEMNRKNRPDLVQDVWRVLEPMKRDGALSNPPPSTSSSSSSSINLGS